MGLDQAGKTSILNILDQNYNLMDNLKPTIGIERHEINILGISVMNWDLGGQERFRKDYFKNVKVFEQTDALFFVIDALNATRYEEALDYYDKILQLFGKLRLKPKIAILIHKVDPNMINDPETLEMIEEIKQLVLSKSEDYEISFYTTSIFDRKSIIEAFSRNLQELISELKPFKKILESLGLSLKLDAVILFDEKLMILSEFYSSEEIEEVCLSTVYNSVYYMTHTNPKLAEDFQTNFELVLNVKNQKKGFQFTDVKFKGWNLYLLTMSDEKAQKIDKDAVIARFDAMSHLFKEREE